MCHHLVNDILLLTTLFNIVKKVVFPKERYPTVSVLFIYVTEEVGSRDVMYKHSLGWQRHTEGRWVHCGR